MKVVVMGSHGIITESSDPKLPPGMMVKTTKTWTDTKPEDLEGIVAVKNFANKVPILGNGIRLAS